MRIEDIEKLIEAATRATDRIGEALITFSSDSSEAEHRRLGELRRAEIDARHSLGEASRTLLPLLLNVARAAKAHAHYCDAGDLLIALEKLEAE